MNPIEILWNDGTTDKIYLDFTQVETQGVLVTSDPNLLGYSRSREIKFSSNKPSIYQHVFLRVEQTSDNILVVVYDNSASVYDNSKAIQQ